MGIMMKRNQIKAGTILSYLQIGTNICIQLLYTPIIIRLLGKSEYGLYNTVISTISMLSILNLGFSAGYVRYYAIYKKNEADESIKKLNGLFLVIFSFIGIISLLCGMYLTNHLNYIFNSGLSDLEYETAQKLMFLLTINMSISFPMSVFTTIISAHERFVILKLIGMIRTVFCPLITLPFLFAGFRSVAIVLITVIVSLFSDLIYIIYVIFFMKESFRVNGIEKNLFCGLLGFTFFIALNTLIDQINLNIDKLLLGRFKGTSEVAVYSVGYTIYHSYMMLSTSVSGVFTPRVHMLVNRTNEYPDLQRRQLTDLFIKVGRIQISILMLVATGFLFFGKYFINIWAGEGYEVSFYVALILILSSTVPLIQNIGIEIQRAENLHQFRSIAYLLMAFLNLAFSIYLCQIYGAIGSTIGTAVSLIVANGIIMNIYYHKKCNLDIMAFWTSIIRLSAGVLPAIFYGIFYTCFVRIDTIIKFCFGIVSYGLVYCVSIWILGMNVSEKNLVLMPLKKIFHKG